MHDRPSERAGRRGRRLLQDRGPGEIRVLCRHRHGRVPACAGRCAGRARQPTPIWRDEVEHVCAPALLDRLLLSVSPGSTTENSRYIRDWQICAVVESLRRRTETATLSLRNKFSHGRRRWRSWRRTARPFSLAVPEMARRRRAARRSSRETPRMTFTMPLPRSVPAMSFVRHAVEIERKGLKRKNAAIGR